MPEASECWITSISQHFPRLYRCNPQQSLEHRFIRKQWMSSANSQLNRNSHTRMQPQQSSKIHWYCSGNSIAVREVLRAIIDHLFMLRITNCSNDDNKNFPTQLRSCLGSCDERRVKVIIFIAAWAQAPVECECEIEARRSLAYVHSSIGRGLRNLNIFIRCANSI